MDRNSRVIFVTKCFVAMMTQTPYINQPFVGRIWTPESVIMTIAKHESSKETVFFWRFVFRAVKHLLRRNISERFRISHKQVLRNV